MRDRISRETRQASQVQAGEHQKQRVYSEHTGRNDSVIAIGGGTYAKEMPNIVASGPMMPDQEEVEHQANEYIAVDHLVSVTKIYAQDIYELAR